MVYKWTGRPLPSKPLTCNPFCDKAPANPDKAVAAKQGTVAKGFALMLGLVLSTMIQAVLDAQNEPPQQQEQDSANESYEQPLARTNKQDHTEPANQADLAAVGKPASTESRRTSSMGRNQIAGTLLVLLSGWMHFTNPPKR